MPAPSQKAREYILSSALKGDELSPASDLDSFTLELREALREALKTVGLVYEAQGPTMKRLTAVLASYTPSPEEEKG